MRQLLLLLTLLATAGATTPVTGNLADLSGTAVTSKSKVRLWLRGCNGNQPRVIGTTIIAPTNGNTFFFDLVPNGSGALSGTIYSNDVNVSCGGQTGVTWYGMQVLVNGTPGPETCLNAVDGVTLNLNSALPCNANPVVPAPTGDNTYARLDATNQPFKGPVLLTGNGPGGIGNPSGGAINIQKASAPSAIYMGRAVDVFGNTNSQLLGFDVEQMVNPTISMGLQNSAYIGELFVPIGNTQTFTGSQITADFAFINYGSGPFSGNSGVGALGEAWNSGPATNITELDGISGGCHNGSVTAGIPPQTPTGNGSVSNCRGVVGSVSNSSSGTITNAVTLYANSIANTGGGTITNVYGLFLGDQTAGVNNFAIKTGLGTVSFADKVQANSSFYATGLSAFGTTGLLANDILFVGGSGVATGVNQFGLQVAPTLNGTSESAAIVARADVAASTTVNLSTGVHITTPIINSGGSISEWDGLRIETSPSSTNHFGLKQIGAGDINSFAGEVQTPKLTLNGGTSLTGQTGSGPSIVTNTSPTISSPTFNTGVTNSGTGFKHGRITTGSINATTRTDVTLAWAGTAFADTNYTPTCSIIETTVAAGTQSLVVERIHTLNTGNIIVSVFNGTGGALTGTLTCSAFHD